VSAGGFDPLALLLFLPPHQHLKWPTVSERRSHLTGPGTRYSFSLLGARWQVFTLEVKGQ